MISCLTHHMLVNSVYLASNLRIVALFQHCFDIETTTLGRPEPHPTLRTEAPTTCAD